MSLVYLRPWVALGLVALVSVAGERAAFANDASFGGCGGIMAALDGPHACRPIANPDIELVEETLHFVLDPGDSAVSDRIYGGKWRVEGRYLLRNHGAAQSLTIGFPVRGPWNEEAMMLRAEERPALEKYEVALDGKPSEAKLFVALAEGDEGAKCDAERFGYTHAYLTEVAFEAGQTRELVHRYEHGLGSNYYGYVYFAYILKTGGLWRGGTIGKATITLEIGEPMAACLAASYPTSEADWSAQKFSWVLEGFAPERDFDLMVVLSRAAAFFELGFLEVAQDGDLTEMRAAAADLSAEDVERAYENVLTLYRWQRDAKGQGGDKGKARDPKRSKSKEGKSTRAVPPLSCAQFVDLEPDAALFDAAGKPIGKSWARDVTRAGVAPVPVDHYPPWVLMVLEVLDADLSQRKVPHTPLPAP